MTERLDDGRRGQMGVRAGRFVHRWLALGAVLALAVVSAAVASAARHRPKPTTQVAITRDRHGIPHIVARNFDALGLGEGYAFAQDNLCTFADDIVTLEG